jgi:hypothetical protein
MGGIDSSMSRVLGKSPMKDSYQLALAWGIAAIGLAACNTSSGPIGFGSADPLRAPGSDLGPSSIEAEGFSAGQFVRAVVDNTAFYLKRPKGDADADKLLRRGTSMKVISAGGSYLKVELDSGEVGFVPPVMVEGMADSTDSGMAYPTNPNEIQLYPPLSGSASTLPPIGSGEQPPSGAIPTVIDPEEPSPASTPPIAPPDQTPPNPTEPSTPDANASSSAPTTHSKELEEMKRKAEELAPKEGESPAQ